MYKRLLTFIVVLSLVSVASAIVIDDFESYANTAELRAAWVDASLNNQQQSTGVSYATPTLVTLGDGSKAMLVTYVLQGGWDYPDAAAPWEEGYVKAEWEATSDTARIAMTLADSINIAADYGENWQLKFSVKPIGHINNLGDLNVYGIDESEAYGRSLIPCPVDEHFQWWYPPEWCPAYMAEPGWVFPNNGGGTYGKYAGLDPLDVPPGGYLSYIYSGEWGEIICDNTRELNYAWGNVEMSTLTGLIKIAFEVNSDTNLGAEFLREAEGGDIYPIQGGTYAFIIDDIELVPEPATIALLGLGGLALLRVRRKG
jgi:hypothetical protein